MSHAIQTLCCVLMAHADRPQAVVGMPHVVHGACSSNWTVVLPPQCLPLFLFLACSFVAVHLLRPLPWLAPQLAPSGSRKIRTWDTQSVRARFRLPSCTHPIQHRLIAHLLPCLGAHSSAAYIAQLPTARFASRGRCQAHAFRPWSRLRALDIRDIQADGAVRPQRRTWGFGNSVRNTGVFFYLDIVHPASTCLGRGALYVGGLHAPCQSRRLYLRK